MLADCQKPRHWGLALRDAPRTACVGQWVPAEGGEVRLFGKRRQTSLPKSRTCGAGLFHQLLIRRIFHYLVLSPALDTTSCIRCPTRSYILPPFLLINFLCLITLSLFAIETLNYWKSKKTRKVKKEAFSFQCLSLGWTFTAKKSQSTKAGGYSHIQLCLFSSAGMHDTVLVHIRFHSF